ncbi:MAG: hypothetical protein ACKPKO_13290, partial [Candidatus Fonsibacter sp.]
VDNATDPLVQVEGGIFTTGNNSTVWAILNAQVKCDLVTLDSGLNDSYVKLLEDGKKLTLNYNTFISQYQTISNQTDFSINITRSLTRLKSVFVSFWKNFQDETRQDMRANRMFNDFFSPMHLNTFISQYQTISNQTDFAINITRSLTRLKSVFVSFWKN